MGKSRPLRERFQDKVAVSTGGCWEWSGCVTSDGYGLIGVRKGGHSTSLKAHRVAYELYIGPIPDGLQIDHLCRNRRCVNPQHLEPVTCRENVLRGEGLAAKAALKTHCKRGHLFDEANTYRRGRARYCRACPNEKRRAKRRAQGGVSNRQKTHCTNGHEYTDSNTYRNPAGYRSCRTCRRMHGSHAQQRRNRAEV